MSKAASFATLKPRLLASKGAARPAMRPGNATGLDALSEGQNALGWNDLGEPHSGPASLDGTLVSQTKPSDHNTASAACENTARKAAFTLRLDAERHLRLRLASTMQNRSAQRLVTEALDRFLEDMPQLDSLAHQVSQTASKA